VLNFNSTLQYIDIMYYMKNKSLGRFGSERSGFKLPVSEREGRKAARAYFLQTTYGWKEEELKKVP